MSVVDIIITILLVVSSSLIIYFCFWKNRKNPCHGCPYAKKCDKEKCSKKSNKENIV